MENLQIVSSCVLGFIAVYIAWRHWWTDELKRRRDLHERRLKVYDGLIDFLEDFENASDKEFIRQVRESPFLFSDEIVSYLGEVRSKWVRYKVVRGILADPSSKPTPEHPDFPKFSKEREELGWWLHTQSPVATEKFVKEMSLND